MYVYITIINLTKNSQNYNKNLEKFIYFLKIKSKFIDCYRKETKNKLNSVIISEIIIIMIFFGDYH